MSVYSIHLGRRYGYGTGFSSLNVPQNMRKLFLNSSDNACKISELLLHKQSLRRQLKNLKSLKKV